MGLAKRNDRDALVDGTAPCAMCGETVPIDVSGHCELGHRVTSPEIAVQALEHIADFDEPGCDGVSQAEAVADQSVAARLVADEPVAADPVEEPVSAEPARSDPLDGEPVEEQVVIEERGGAEPAAQPDFDLDYDSLLGNGSHPR